jgi:hypothetical protein
LEAIPIYILVNYETWNDVIIALVLEKWRFENRTYRNNSTDNINFDSCFHNLFKIFPTIETKKKDLNLFMSKIMEVSENWITNGIFKENFIQMMAEIYIKTNYKQLTPDEDEDIWLAIIYRIKECRKYNY